MKKTTLSVSALALIAALAGASAGWSQDTAPATDAPVAGQMGDKMGGPMGDKMGGPGFDFAAIDANSDGKITPEEVEAFKAARLAEIDTNADGKLSAEELIAGREKAEAAHKTARAEAMVKQFDKDGDGLLSAAEMPAGPGADKMFAHLDTDSDGAISQAEMDAAKAQMQDHRGGHQGGKHGGRGDHGGRGNDGFWGMFGGGADDAPAN